MGEIQYIANLPKLNNTKLGKLKSSIIKAIDWLNTKWMLKVLLQFLPMIWTSLILKIEFFARLLYNDEGNLNEYGIKIGVTIYFLSLAVMLLTIAIIKNNHTQKQESNQWRQSRAEMRSRAL